MLRVDPRHPARAPVSAAARVLCAGGLAILPTDTVYGVAAAPGMEQRIYAAKGRDPNKPIPLLAADIHEVARWGAAMGERARRLAERFWPGPLTLVLRVGDGYEGFRVPNHPVTLAVLRAAGGILRVTSANRSGEPAACDAKAAAAALAGHVGIVLDAGPSPLGAESSVVQEDGTELRILRNGAIPADEILARPMILFVCTGNLCRSPMAEYLLRHWLGADSAWTVESAGLSAADGLPISAEAAAVLAEKGIDAGAHRSRSLTQGLVDAARIIVVMTNDHRDFIQRRFEGAVDKIQLLKSFGYAERDEDVQDPIGAPIEEYRKVRDQMDAVMPDLVLDLRNMLDQ